MPPKITNSTRWQQAETLMQPAFIRVIDNIRKHLDVSDWKGTYHDVLIWPAGTSDQTKAIVTQLIEEMETAAPKHLEEIRENLARLPIPHPGYHLRLQRQEQQVNVDLWELCYQVCFMNYSPENISVDVYIDTSLIDELGQIEWQLLENKTQQVVKKVFDSLPEG
ncbi:MAG: hypothetical protein F6K62_13685 [Sphaerospermopsis sp. SIO1G2]|nr:hypothetical protein [Sphaerospermopsis sp. SIO1G2]